MISLPSIEGFGSKFSSNISLKIANVGFSNSYTTTFIKFSLKIICAIFKSSNITDDTISSRAFTIEVILDFL